MGVVGAQIGRPFGRRLPVSVGGVVVSQFSTWNPADKSALIILSGSDLIATRSATSPFAGASGRALPTATTGSFKYEITINLDGSAGTTVLGLSTAASPTNGSLNGSGDFGWSSDGAVTVNGVAGVAFEPYTTGDVISIEFNRTSRAVNIQKLGGGARSNAYVLSAGTYVPAVSMLQPGNFNTANFGASAWSIAATSGYVGWPSS